MCVEATIYQLICDSLVHTLIICLQLGYINTTVCANTGELITSAPMQTYRRGSVLLLIHPLPFQEQIYFFSLLKLLQY